MKECILQIGKVLSWDDKTPVLEGLYEWFLKLLQRVEFKLRKPVYVMIPYDFKYLWNTSNQLQLPDFLKETVIVSSPFPVGGLRED